MTAKGLTDQPKRFGPGALWEHFSKFQKAYHKIGQILAMGPRWVGNLRHDSNKTLGVCYPKKLLLKS